MQIPEKIRKRLCLCLAAVVNYLITFHDVKSN